MSGPDPDARIRLAAIRAIAAIAGVTFLFIAFWATARVEPRALCLAPKVQIATGVGPF